MHDITKHDTEKERERHNSWNSRIELLVVRCSICIDNRLKCKHEFVFLERSWFFNQKGTIINLFKVQLNVLLVSESSENFVKLCRSWTPRNSLVDF